jgi:acylphosphatase
MPTIKNKIIINGLKVHDVGYRVFLLNRALTSGLTGFSAFNHTTSDNVQQIEICIEGDADTIEEFVTGLHNNIPVHAIVDNISIESFSKRVISILDYMHLAQVEQLDKGIPAILSIQSSQEKMLEKQDQMLEIQKQMVDTQKQTNKEIQTLRYDLKTEMNERFNKIEDELKQVKDTLHKHGIMA